MLGRGVARIQTQAVSFSTTSISICPTGVNGYEANTASGLALPTGTSVKMIQRGLLGRWGGAGVVVVIAVKNYISHTTPQGRRNQKSASDFSKIYLIILPGTMVEIPMASTVLSSEVAKI